MVHHDPLGSHQAVIVIRQSAVKICHYHHTSHQQHHLRLRQVESRGQVEPVRAHHVLGLPELLLQELQLLGSEDSPDPLGLYSPPASLSP